MVKNFIDSPLPFDGSSEAKKANIDTHEWIREDDEVFCSKCDCFYASFISEWPCCYPVPRTSDLK